MGTSYTHFQSVGFWTNDTGIELWLLLLTRDLQQLSNRPAWVDEAIAHWNTQATGGFTGCVDAALDRICASEERVAVVVAAGLRVADWLRARAPSLSRSLLDSLDLGGSGTHFTQDLAIDYPLRVGEAFVGLLTGTVAPPSPGEMNFVRP